MEILEEQETLTDQHSLQIHTPVKFHGFGPFSNDLSKAIQGCVTDSAQCWCFPGPDPRLLQEQFLFVLMERVIMADTKRWHSWMHLQ